MAKNKAAPAAPAPKMPDWFDKAKHRVEPRGIVFAASGDLLADDGLPVNEHARRLWLAAAAAKTTEAPAEAPAADQE